MYSFNHLSNNSILSSNLKHIRLSYGFLGKDLASIMETTYRNYKKYEAGESEPGAYKIARLSFYIGISMEWIMGLSQNPYDDSYISSIEDTIWSRNTNNELSIYKPFSINDQNFKINIFTHNSLLIIP